jgi:hypothetical protein
MVPPRSPLVLPLLVLWIVIGCAANHQAIDATTSTVPSIRWSGSLTNVPGSAIAPDARALIVPGHSGTESYAIISLAGGSPGVRHSWHVHSGTCESPGATFGPTNVYAPLVVRADGNAQAMARLPLVTPSDGSYHVDLHSHTGDGIIACGELILEETRLPPPTLVSRFAPHVSP